jgi:hypothetical protein
LRYTTMVIGPREPRAQVWEVEDEKVASADVNEGTHVTTYDVVAVEGAPAA